MKAVFLISICMLMLAASTAMAGNISDNDSPVLGSIISAGLVGTSGAMASGGAPAAALGGKILLSYSAAVLIALSNMEHHEKWLTIMSPIVAPTQSTENNGRKKLDKANAQLVAEDAIQYQATGEKTPTFQEHCDSIRNEYAQAYGLDSGNIALPDDDKIAVASIWAAQQM